MAFYYICGPHCSGKSTIIKRLHAEGVAHFAGNEIGKQFYYDRKARGFATAAANAAFELEVANAELQRDASLIGLQGTAVVETWHPGNLAYAAVRNPEAVPALTRHIQNNSRLLRQGNVTGIFISVLPEQISRRTKTFAADPAWAADFYQQIERALPLCLALLGCAATTVRVDGNGPLEYTYSQVRSIISGNGTAALVSKTGLNGTTRANSGCAL